MLAIVQQFFHRQTWQWICIVFCCWPLTMNLDQCRI